ncbi:MAG: hypothetical protein WEC84_01425, partial [Candidatus Andersenbacteria bacterium]
MERVASGQWVKPASGYKDPDPECPACEGSGKSSGQVHFPDPATTVLWLGRCPDCGAGNGAYFQRQGTPAPQADKHWHCVSDDCARPQVELVLASAVTAWSATCPVCSLLGMSFL